MAQQTLELNPSQGMVRNRGESDPFDPRSQTRIVYPDEIHNLIPDPERGVTPFGALDISLSTILDDWEDIAAFDFDERGYVTFISGVAAAIRGATSHDNAAFGTSTDATHIPGAGLSRLLSGYFLEKSNGTPLRSSDSPAAPTYTITNVRGTTGSLQSNRHYIVLVLTFYELSNGLKWYTHSQLTSVIPGGTIDNANDLTIQVDVTAVPTDAQVEVYLAEKGLLGGITSTIESFIPTPFKLVRRISAAETIDIDNPPADTTFVTIDGTSFYRSVPYRVAALWNRRLWGRASADGSWVGYDLSAPNGNLDDPPKPITPLTLWYSEQDCGNLCTINSTIEIPAVRSSAITAIVPMASNRYGQLGGLLVFCDNETWLVTGDVALNNLDLEPHPILIGCDAGKKPVTLGEIIFVIWQGQLWMLTPEGAKPIGNNIKKFGESWQKVRVDPSSQSLIALLSNGKWYRYIIQHDYWLVDLPAPSGTGAIVDAYPNGAGGLRYGTSGGYELSWSKLPSGTLPPSKIIYRNLELSGQHSADKIISVRTYTRNYAGINGMRMHYKCNGTHGDVDTGSAEILNPRNYGNIAELEGDTLFTLPRHIRGRQWDIALIYASPDVDLIVEHPIVLTWAQGYTLRR